MIRISYKGGFTIVELLVVVAVIGILVAVTAVAYNGVQGSARDKSVLSDIDAVEAEVTRYAVNNSGSYGSSVAWYSGTGGGPSTNPNIVFTPSTGNVIDIVADTTQYCIRAYNTGSSTYKNITSAAYKESTPGACAALAASTGAIADSPGAPETPPPPPDPPALPTITNLSTNPSVETNTTGLTGPNSTSIALDTSRSKYGSASVRATMPIKTASNVGVGVASSFSVPGVLELGTTYIVSAYVYVPTGTVDVRFSVQGSGKQTVTYVPGYATSVKDSWVRISQAFTTITSGSGTVSVYILNKDATTVAGTQFWADGVMLTSGTTLYDFADGNTSGWSWTGTQNNSNSSGPGVASS